LKKTPNFFAENCQKSQKIVILTSTPGHTARIPVSPFSISVFSCFRGAKAQPKIALVTPPGPPKSGNDFIEEQIFSTGVHEPGKLGDTKKYFLPL
jgi:hypothetical protein